MPRCCGYRRRREFGATLSFRAAAVNGAVFVATAP